LRSIGATHVERSTIDDTALNAVHRTAAAACDATGACEACQ
jgi:hypothetical protein